MELRSPEGAGHGPPRPRPQEGAEPRRRRGVHVRAREGDGDGVLREDSDGGDERRHELRQLDERRG